MHIQEYISHHPVLSLTICLVNLMGAIALTIAEIPLGVKDWFQVGAWASTILVGTITVLSWSHRVYKKYFKK